MKIPPLISYLGKSVGFGLAMAALLLLVFPNFRGGAPLPGLITNARELSFSYAAHRAGPAGTWRAACRARRPAGPRAGRRTARPELTAHLFC